MPREVEEVELTLFQLLDIVLDAVESFAETVVLEVEQAESGGQLLREPKRRSRSAS